MIDEYEDFALGNFLCQWDENATYNENIEALKHEECDWKKPCTICDRRQEISIWEPFENYDGKYVAEQIENMLESIKRSFIPKVIKNDN